MKMILKWFLLLNKRLYKKTTFVVILALIPIVVLGLSIIAKNDSGFVTVALSQLDDKDPISNEIIKDLTSSSELIRFVHIDDPKKAFEGVKTGQYDSAWIFLDDLGEKIQKFSTDPDIENAMVNVVEREQNVLLRTSHEKLSCVLYKYISKDLYKGYIRTNVSQLDNLSDEQLAKYYDSYFCEGKLFEFSYPSDESVAVQDINYLVAPVRGVLSVLVVLCAMAGAMFFVEDKKSGTFAWVPQSKEKYIEFLCQVIAALNVSIAIAIALKLAGLFVGFKREATVLALYVIACSLFGMLLRNIFNNTKILGALLPLFVTTMIAVCPVFFEWKELKWLQMMFPPTYYINAINNKQFITYLLMYIVVCIALITAIKIIKKAKMMLR